MGTKIMTHLHWANESSTSVRRARAAHQTRSFELSRTITWLLRRSAPDGNIGSLRTKAPGTMRETHTLDKFAQRRASRWKQPPFFLPNWPLIESSVVNSCNKQLFPGKGGKLMHSSLLSIQDMTTGHVLVVSHQTPHYNLVCVFDWSSRVELDLVEENQIDLIVIVSSLLSLLWLSLLSSINTNSCTSDLCSIVLSVGIYFFWLRCIS